MKKEEKQLIYTLLKTADAYESGYTRPQFAGEPVFQDDTEVSFPGVTGESRQSSDVEMPGSSPSMTENASATMTQSLTLDELNAKILRCTRCGLARTRNNVVPGMGVEHPDVLVIGEGPGHDEDMQGLPFVGKAGVLLDRMLAAIGLDRKTNCYIANIVKCRPPENRNPMPDEQSACFSFLEAQIHLLKPKMILCMGKIAIEKITGQNISINAQHGEFFEYNGIPVMPTYHPSALLRNEELKRPAWEDLKLFKKRLDEIKNN
jgi:DNA polymerase